jgi:hypothetical protein
MIGYLLEKGRKNSNKCENPPPPSLKSRSIPHPYLPPSPDIHTALVCPASNKPEPGSLSFAFNYMKMLNKNL